MTVQITFEGEFSSRNRISLRTLGQTYTGLQKAIERTYLSIERDGLLKGERSDKESIKATEFFLEQYRDGSFICVFRESSDQLLRVIDHLSSIIRNPYEIAMSEGDIEHQTIVRSLQEINQNPISEPINYVNAISDSSINDPRSYAPKSIANYINQSLIPVKRHGGNNRIIYRLTGHEDHQFIFDKTTAERFYSAISGKGIGPLIRYESELIKISSTTLSGSIKHTYNRKEAIIKFMTAGDYNQAAPYVELGRDQKPIQPMSFLGYPILEMNKIDLESGDVIFKELISEDDI